MEPLSVNEAEKIDRIGNLNLNFNKSPGPDLIHPRILCELRNEIGYPLMKIFNCSLVTKVLSTEWKSANVSAVFNIGNKKLSYRLETVRQQRISL